MRVIHPKRLLVLVAGAALAGVPAIAADEAPPKENKGMKAPVLTSIDLGPEIAGMEGRQLRMRVITLEPGGAIAIHSHKDRPAVVHLLHGTFTERREGGFVKERHEGESWSEGHETTHWTENRGTAPATALVVDVYKP